MKTSWKRILIVAVALLSLNLLVDLARAQPLDTGKTPVAGSDVDTVSLYNGTFMICDTQEQVIQYLESRFVLGMSHVEARDDVGRNEKGSLYCGVANWIYKYTGDKPHLMPDIDGGTQINRIIIFGFIGKNGLGVRIKAIAQYGFSQIQ